MSVGAALVGIGGSVLNAVHNRYLRLEQRNYDQQLMREANAYNSPAAQVARYKAAGLNPSLLLQNPDPGNSQPIQGEVQRSPDYGSVFSNAMQNTLLDTQRELLQSQTEKNEAETGKVQAETQTLTQTLPKMLSEMDVRIKNIEELTKQYEANSAYLVSLTGGQNWINNTQYWRSREASIDYFSSRRRFDHLNEYISAELSQMWSSAESSKGFGNYMQSMADLNFKSMSYMIQQRYWLARDAQYTASLHYHQAANEGLTFQNRNMPLGAIPVTDSQRQYRLQTELLTQQLKDYPFHRFMDYKRYVLEGKRLDFDMSKFDREMKLEYGKMTADIILREQQMMMQMFQSSMQAGAQLGSTALMLIK